MSLTGFMDELLLRKLKKIHDNFADHPCLAIPLDS